MARLWRNIQDTVSFAVAAQAPVPLQQITDAALLCINRTQCYKTAYLAYRQLAVQNYQVLKAHFEQAEHDFRKRIRLSNDTFVELAKVAEEPYGSWFPWIF